MRLTLETVAVRHAAHVSDFERRFLSAGWHDPAGLHDSAREYHLSGRSFIGAHHDFLYAALAACATCGIEPTEDLILELARLEKEPTDRIADLLKGLRWLEPHGLAVRAYARSLAGYAHRRARAQKLIGLAGRLVGEDVIAMSREPLADPTPRSGIVIPSHVQDRLRSARSARITL